MQYVRTPKKVKNDKDLNVAEIKILKPNKFKKRKKKKENDFIEKTLFDLE